MTTLVSAQKALPRYAGAGSPSSFLLTAVGAGRRGGHLGAAHSAAGAWDCGAVGTSITTLRAQLGHQRVESRGGSS